MLLDVACNHLLVIDMQEKLLPKMFARARIEENCRRLIEAARLLTMPILFSEQYPQGLGPTSPALMKTDDEPPVTKMAFSCAHEPDYLSRLLSHGRKQLVICGIESHVCVLQTALELQQAEYHCIVVSDAVSSRSARDHRLACARMRDHGIEIVTTEMILFEWIRTATHPLFKTISALVK